MTEAASSGYELCLAADPYWLTNINTYEIPLRLVEHLGQPYRAAVEAAVEALRHEDPEAAGRAILTARAAAADDGGLADHLAGLAAAGRRRFDEAMALIGRGLAQRDCAEYRNNAGVACVKAGRIAEAVGLFEAATRLAPGFGHPFAALALLHTLARHWPEAEAAARAATRLKARLGAGLVDLCLMSATIEQGRPPKGAFDFASLDEDGDIEAALAYLPPVDPAELRHRCPGRYAVFLACNDDYFWRHAVPCVWSMVDVRPDCSIHLHVANAGEEARTAISKMGARMPLTASFETVDPRRYYGKGTYFSSARFCRLYQFLRLNRRPTVMVDADTLWRRDIGPILAATDPAEVTFCRLPAQPPWARLVGRFIFVRPTAGAEAFLERLALFIADNFRKNTARWFLDQVGLYAVQRRTGEDVRFAYLPESEVSDRRFTDASALWTVTNELKKQDNRYSAYKKSLMEKYGDPRQPR